MFHSPMAETAGTLDWALHISTYRVHFILRGPLTGHCTSRIQSLKSVFSCQASCMNPALHEFRLDIVVNDSKFRSELLNCNLLRLNTSRICSAVWDRDLSIMRYSGYELDQKIHYLQV